MKLITWNVQWCRGVDGAVDPARIVSEARRLADFDLLCLQEIADNYPDPRLAGSDGEDQFARLAQLLPGFTAVPGIAVDQPGDDGRRRRFVPGMPRIAVEAVIATSEGDLRVVTTHLEYYSAKQRMAQVEALRAIYAEGHAYARGAQVTMSDGGPFQTFIRPRETVITGDCNFEPDSTEHRRRLAPFADGTPPLVDAFSALHPGRAHPPTFKIYEKKRPDEPELHCDFIFIGEELRARMRDVRVDVKTQAADHQPVILTLA